MTTLQTKQLGLGLIEIMVAIALSLFIMASLLTVYQAQTQTYKTTASQSIIQNSENTISQLLLPNIQNAGYAGCGVLTTAASMLNSSASYAPLASLNTTGAFVTGYQATTNTISPNSANNSSSSSWLPSLDSSLVGNVEVGSDVLVVLGPSIGMSPTSVTNISQASNSFTVESAPTVTAGQYGVISDCAKSLVFRITGLTGTTISHLSGTGTLENYSSTFPISFPIGAQFIPLQQTAYFVGQGLGGQSSLMRATLTGTNWDIEPLVPGVDTMKVLYGIGTNGTPTQYVSASNVTDWTQVLTIRIVFLLEGQLGTGFITGGAVSTYNMFGSSVTVPADSRLRHVYEIAINLRNAI